MSVNCSRKTFSFSVFAYYFLFKLMSLYILKWAKNFWCGERSLWLGRVHPHQFFRFEHWSWATTRCARPCSIYNVHVSSMKIGTQFLMLTMKVNRILFLLQNAVSSRQQRATPSRWCDSRESNITFENYARFVHQGQIFEGDRHGPCYIIVNSVIKFKYIRLFYILFKGKIIESDSHRGWVIGTYV